MGERLTVQFARGTRNRDTFANTERNAPPRPRRTPHRMQISGLPGETSWQPTRLDLVKPASFHGHVFLATNSRATIHTLALATLQTWTTTYMDSGYFARQSSLDVVYSETGRDRDGKGSFVEFETAADLKTAVEKLDGREFKGARVTCTADTQPDIPRDRARSRSPMPRGRPYPVDDYDRRGPPRGYSPRRDGYRDRSPPRRGYYDDDRRYGRSPPRPRGPIDDYPPPPRRGGFDDPYRRDYPPADPYVNGHGRPPYDRPPRDYPPRDAGYADDGYRRGRYW
ncbi:hypothetical protein CJF32_00007607 [Rutstroemia sp. NJR-2017a WRK4]|nr:hypothetical protein CJF32_00007607 [Rutstroemia sp. NJR-2017a WRK4]